LQNYTLILFIYFINKIDINHNGLFLYGLAGTLALIRKMIFTLIILEITIFSILSGIHWNWVFGGNWGFENAIPTNLEGNKIFNPKKIESSLVAIGLLVFATYYFLISDLISFKFPNWISLYVGWVVSFIFILRSIGDFKYFGFFKTIKTSNFGKMDSKLFSPLCVIIGLIGIIIELNKW